MKIVLATHNQDKVREIADLLAGLDVEIATMDAFPAVPPTVEDGDTLEANAVKKAREARDLPGGARSPTTPVSRSTRWAAPPGVFAARYAGEGATYEATGRSSSPGWRTCPPENARRVSAR